MVCGLLKVEFGMQVMFLVFSSVVQKFMLLVMVSLLWCLLNVQEMFGNVQNVFCGCGQIMLGIVFSVVIMVLCLVVNLVYLVCGMFCGLLSVVIVVVVIIFGRLVMWLELSVVIVLVIDFGLVMKFICQLGMLQVLDSELMNIRWFFSFGLVCMKLWQLRLLNIIELQMLLVMIQVFGYFISILVNVVIFLFVQIMLVGFDGLLNRNIFGLCLSVFFNCVGISLQFCFGLQCRMFVFVLMMLVMLWQVVQNGVVKQILLFLLSIVLVRLYSICLVLMLMERFMWLQLVRFSVLMCLRNVLSSVLVLWLLLYWLELWLSDLCVVVYMCLLGRKFGMLMEKLIMLWLVVLSCLVFLVISMIVLGLV